MAGQVATAERASEVWRAFLRVAFVLLWFPGGLLLGFILLPLIRMAFAQTWHTLGSVAAMGDVRSAIWLSVQSAGATAAVAAVLGTPLAYFLARGNAWCIRVIQALVDLPQSQHAGVGGEPFGAVFDDDRAVEIERKKRMLRFTHGVHLRVRSVSSKTPTKLHAEAAFSSATPRP